MSKMKTYSFRGQALVEMALLLMILLIITMIVLDLGRAFYYYTVISNAAREGARYGIVNPLVFNPLTGVCEENIRGIEDAVLEKALGLDQTSLTIKYDHDEEDTLYPYDPVTEVDCNPIKTMGINCYCDSGEVSVILQYKFAPVTPLIENFIGGGITVNASSIMLVEQ